jgi:hypothetical protein
LLQRAVAVEIDASWLEVRHGRSGDHAS